MRYDQVSYIMGMITAFCECVAGGCKRMALSPPLTEGEYEAVRREAERVIEAHGLRHYHEKNEDAPEGKRWQWIVIYRREETIGEYLRIRSEGKRPTESLEPFYGVLSYDEKESVHTGYDAYKEAFEGRSEG